MKISGDREQFLKGIQTVQNIAGEASVLPILSNVVIETINGGVQFLATDLKTSISYYIPIDVKGQGAISLPAKKLSEIIKELPESTIEFEVEEGNRAKIHSGKVRYQILGFSKDDFPKLPVLHQGETIHIPSGILRKMIQATLYAAAQDDTRYILNGCLLIVTPEFVRLVATDGHRMASAQVNLTQTSSWQAIIPSKTLVELVRVLPQTQDMVTMKTADNKIEFQMKDLKIIASLIQGQFPNIEEVLKRAYKHAVPIDTQLLLKTVRRVSLVALDKSNTIRLELHPGRLTVYAQTVELGEAKEEVELRYDGPETVILLNFRYLLDALKASGSDETMLTFNDGASALGLLVKGDTPGNHVIMPIRPN